MISINRIGAVVTKKSDIEGLYLDTQTRPSAIEERISEAFEGCRYFRKVEGSWPHNGCEQYTLCGVNEQKLVKKIILDSSDSRKEFYVLDIGGGDFSWSHTLAHFIDAQSNISPDIKVHIVGTRAEVDEKTPKIEETARCILHNMQATRAEHLSEDFQKQGMNLINKIDVIVSNMCFPHLVDPVGALVNSFNMLRPKTGFLLFDKFIFAIEGKPSLKDGDNEITTENVKRLLLNMHVPFLINNECKCMVRRPDDTPCQLPMTYTGKIIDKDFAGGVGIASRAITEFRRVTRHEEERTVPIRQIGVVQGDKSLYEWVRQNYLFKCPRMMWEPIFDIKMQDPPLFQAILGGNQKDIEHLLSDPRTNFNESDMNGASACHKAIIKKDLKTVQTLVQKGANIELSTWLGATPLHFAAVYDTTGEITKELLRAGAQLNHLMKAQYWTMNASTTPLDKAITLRNLVVAELLIKAGARICSTSLEEFKDFAQSLLTGGSISLSQIELSSIPVEKETPSFNPFH